MAEGGSAAVTRARRVAGGLAGRGWRGKSQRRECRQSKVGGVEGGVVTEGRGCEAGREKWWAAWEVICSDLLRETRVRQIMRYDSVGDVRYDRTGTRARRV